MRLIAALAVAAAMAGPISAQGADAPGRTLAPCSERPNCVSSLAPAGDARHHVAPIASGAARDPIAVLRRVIEAMPRATIVESGAGRLRAEFRSRWIGFVDDVDFLNDGQAGLIHVRSASRVGYSDLGVNRRRVEAIRDAYAAALRAQPVAGS